MCSIKVDFAFEFNETGVQGSISYCICDCFSPVFEMVHNWSFANCCLHMFIPSVAKLVRLLFDVQDY